MLLIDTARRSALTLVITAALVRPSPAAAQPAAAGPAAVTRVGPVVPTPTITTARPRTATERRPGARSARAVQTPHEDRRGRYALVGLVVGAGVGWGWFAWRCSHGDDCYSPVGGILIAAAGGVLGALVGLLLAPAPPPR